MVKVVRAVMLVLAEQFDAAQMPKKKKKKKGQDAQNESERADGTAKHSLKVSWGSDRYFNNMQFGGPRGKW